MQLVSYALIIHVSVSTYEIDNTNSKHLELYSIMGEYDNAGFPSTYCLLSTATAIDTGKKKKAIAAWSQFLHDKYGVNPVFIHSDKDMGEIGAAHDMWEAKINLCWWHLRHAIRTRLAKAKLATSPYNVNKKLLNLTIFQCPIDVRLLPYSVFTHIYIFPIVAHIKGLDAFGIGNSSFSL